MPATGNNVKFNYRTKMRNTKSSKRIKLPSTLIAPCGMNCRLCQAYIRDKKSCPGCRGDDSLKPKTRVTCKIKTCEKIVARKLKYCFKCDIFPCANLKHLDDRYIAKYGLSMIDNLNKINTLGIRQFIRNEIKRWSCPECGEMICAHKSTCLSCEYKWR
jgi:Protein of unknown function (DUF3795)